MSGKEQKVHCAFRKMVGVGVLRPHPKNPNHHPKGQILLLARNIRELGWRHPVLVSRRSGYIIAGHARLEAAKVLGLSEVPVDYQAFASEKEELAYLLADNRLAELAEIDMGAVAEAVRELDSAGFENLELTGFDIGAILDFGSANTDSPGRGESVAGTAPDGTEDAPLPRPQQQESEPTARGMFECPHCHRYFRL